MNDVTTLPHHALSPDGHAPPVAHDGQAHGLGTDTTHPAQGGMAARSSASSHHGRDKIDWSHEVWARIDAAVREEIKRSRVAARFLPTVHVPAKSTTVPADGVSATAIAGGGGGATAAGVAPSGVFSVDETSTTRVNEVWVEFSLTPAQVEEEEAAARGVSHGPHPQPQLQEHPQHPLHSQHSQLHSNHHHQTHASTGMSLATRAANILAQIEDSIIFQGLSAFPSALITGPNATAGARFITNDLGLLNLPQTGLPAPYNGIQIVSLALPADQIIPVSPSSTKNGVVLYQERTVSAVAKAFSVLQGKGHYGPYALVLQTTPFADAHSPLPTTLITPAEPIRQLMNAGFYGTGTLPPYIAAIPGLTAGGLGGVYSGYGAGGVWAVAVTAGGAGYRAAPSVTFIGGQGAPATANAVIGGGVVAAINVISGGAANYTSPPVVTLTAAPGDPGAGAAATATVAGGIVTAVNVTNPGAGYAAVPTVNFGLATATATIDGGSITAVTISNPGSGYTAAPQVAITPAAGDPGVGATASVPIILYTGFVVSLGGNTMDLVRGRMNSEDDVIVRFEQKDANGYYRFRVIERFALRLKDITAVVQLQFLPA